MLSTPHYLVSWDSYAWYGYISKALGLQSGSQVVHNKSVLMVLNRYDETCMHGDLPMLSR